MSSQIIQQKIITSARAWIGTPFQLHGRRKQIGCDCIGLIIGIMSELKLNNMHSKQITDSLNYSLQDAPHMLQSALNLNFKAIDQPQLGSIALLKIQSISHHIDILGDYKYGGFSIIHANLMRGQIVEHRFAKMLANTAAAFYQIH